jgi:hypothetical protein
MVASGVVLMWIGLMHFNLTGLQKPGPLETRIANLAKHSVIRLASRHGIPRRRLTQEPVLRQEVHCPERASACSPWLGSAQRGKKVAATTRLRNSETAKQ